MTETDTHARGLSAAPIDPLRYGYSGVDRGEVTDRLLKVIPGMSRLLDVGCGTGTITWNLQQLLKVEAIGIEPNPDRAEAARARGLNVRDDVLSAKLLADLGLFDVILFADVLEHLVDPVSVLQIARSGLKPGGVIVVSVPNVAHWTIRLNLALGRFDYEPTGLMDATHLRWFTKASLRRLFAAAGLAERYYTTTAGSTQPFYISKNPWKRFPAGGRTDLVIRLSEKFPGLFGFQHIMVAGDTKNLCQDRSAERLSHTSSW